MVPKWSAAEFSNVSDDGRYLETTSGHAARELKRLYDQRLRVGHDGIRSPYTIDVTQDNLGRTVYRVRYASLFAGVTDEI